MDTDDFKTILVMQGKERDGDKLRAALAKAGKRPIDLATATKKTRGAVNQWLTAAEFGPSMWITIRNGLVELKIEPTSVRADDPQSSKDDEALELMELIMTTMKSREQIQTIKRIVETNEVSRAHIQWLVTGLILGPTFEKK